MVGCIGVAPAVDAGPVRTAENEAGIKVTRPEPSAGQCRRLIGSEAAGAPTIDIHAFPRKATLPDLPVIGDSSEVGTGLIGGLHSGRPGNIIGSFGPGRRH